jgi:Protein of unknown function (DUF1153)/PilZ domain
MASDATRDPSDIEAPRPDARAEAADVLPRPDARRWYRRDKRKVIAAVRQGLLGFREARQRYRLSYQEFVDWERIAGADERMRRLREDNDRRRFLRISMRSPASLRVAGRRIDCEIENVSATGALLMVSDSRSYPSQILLEVPHGRDALPARIAWRGRNTLGIEFTASPGVVASKFEDRWIEGANALRQKSK